METGPTHSPRCGRVGLPASTAHLQVGPDGGVQLADGGFISTGSQGHDQVQDGQSAQRQETKEELSGGWGRVCTISVLVSTGYGGGGKGQGEEDKGPRRSP